ncbi:hypothetical protein KPATCC21470_4986 [Kitasatospora purpeofusca]
MVGRHTRDRMVVGTRCQGDRHGVHCAIHHHGDVSLGPA